MLFLDGWYVRKVDPKWHFNTQEKTQDLRKMYQVSQLALLTPTWWRMAVKHSKICRLFLFRLNITPHINKLTDNHPFSRMLKTVLNQTNHVYTSTVKFPPREIWYHLASLLGINSEYSYLCVKKFYKEITTLRVNPE